MKITPFLPGHFDALLARADAKIGILANRDSSSYGRLLFRPGLCYSAMTDEGKLLGSGGIAPIHDGVGDAWAAFSVDMSPGASRTWVAIDRAVRDFLDGHIGNDFRRIQTVVRSDFDPGHVWATRLGFTEPRRLDAWGPEGADYDLYRMIG